MMPDDEEGFSLGETYSQIFKIGLSGESFRNSDGTSRQEIIAKSKPGDPVELRREPDNAYDRWAISVHLIGGGQLGYIPAGDSRLANHIDRGGSISAHIAYINGGPTFFEKLLGRKGRNYGCVIEIEKGSFDWNRVEGFRQLDRDASDLCKFAKQHEKTNPQEAIKFYNKAIHTIQTLDSIGKEAQAWRTTRYPINRLSIILDKNGYYAESLSAIDNYYNSDDALGLSEADRDAISKRRIRLIKRDSAT